MTTAATKPAPRRRKAPTENVRIEQEIERQARHVATHRGLPLSDYLSAKLRLLVEQDYKTVVREMQRDAK